MYVIWSNEHRKWWAPNQFGYVDNISSAGRYPREFALSICRNANVAWGRNTIPNEIAVPLSDADLLGFGV